MSLYVPIDEETMQRLREVARQERRRPQEQAAVLLETALSLRGIENLTTERKRQKQSVAGDEQ